MTTNSTARSGGATTVESRTDTYSIDDIVKDVQLIPYIREAVVEFYATKLKPNTRIYAFFDGQPVSEFCRDIGFQLTAANAATATQLVEYGSPLITDANGEFRGEFKIPAGRFFVGEKKLVLSDDQNLSGDPDMESTRAEAVYFAGGLDITKQSVTLNVITPSFETSQIAETPINTPPTSRPVVVPTPVPEAPTDLCAGPVLSPACRCARSGGAWCADPVAQSFIVDNDMFISGLDIYFKQVDMLSDRIFVEIRNMVNGYPGATVLAVKYYTPDQIQPFISDDSTTAFRVSFDTPVFVEGNNQYCFVVGGASPNTRLWFARLGEEVVNIPGKIVEVPATTEVSFRSLNGTTWNAEQFEQIKYKLYRAKFQPGEMKIVFENDHSQDGWDLPDNPFQTQSGQTRVRVYHKNHGLTAGDRVSISLFDLEPFLIRYSDFVPQIGQTIHTSTGRGIITNITSTAVANEYRITVKNMSGIMTAGQTYTCDAMTRSVRDLFLASSMNSRKALSITLNQCYGQVLENSYGVRFPDGTIAGIPVSEFNTEYTSGSLGHSVIEVDSQDTFIINMQTPANRTGRFGGSFIRIYGCNEKYDVFNVSGAYLPYRSSESWKLEGIGHGDIGSIFESANYQRQPALQFQTQEDRFLGQPYKIASEANEQIQLGTDRSIEVTGTFGTTSEFSSPVINLDSFSITTISNRVEMMDREALRSIPVGEPTWVAEEDMVNGTESYKYVTRTVNLAAPANDIHIYLDVYKDLQADFDVYIKRVSVHESNSIEQLPWMKVTGLMKNRSSTDLTDFIEYHIIASEHIVPYSDDGNDYPGWLDGNGEPEPFTAFKVKLVGKTRNSAKPPLFRALRIIAVT